MVANLALAMVATSLTAVETRNLRVAAYAYLAQALLLVAIFFVFAFELNNPLLFVWAAVALVTKATLIPALLFNYLGKTHTQETRPTIGLGVSVVIASIIMVAFYKLVHSQIHFLAPTALATGEPFRTNLAVALTIFTLGLYAMVTRRDALKSVVALCLLENGVHLSLVSLAPNMPEMPVIGIVTEVFVTVWLLLYIIRGVNEQFGTTDSSALQQLRS
jgi:hydrogenase-4 component E